MKKLLCTLNEILQEVDSVILVRCKICLDFDSHEMVPMIFVSEI